MARTLRVLLFLLPCVGSCSVLGDAGISPPRTLDTGDNGRWVANRFQATANGSITTMSMFLEVVEPGSNVTFAVYQDTILSNYTGLNPPGLDWAGVPTRLLSQSDRFTIKQTTPGWLSRPLKTRVFVKEGEFFWLSFYMDSRQDGNRLRILFCVPTTGLYPGQVGFLSYTPGQNFSSSFFEPVPDPYPPFFAKDSPNNTVSIYAEICSSCVVPPSFPPFVSFSCPTELFERESCSWSCNSSFLPVDLTISCGATNLSLPSPSSCIPKDPKAVREVLVSFNLTVFDLNETCGLSLRDDITRSRVISAFLTNVQLELMLDSSLAPVLQSEQLVTGQNDTMQLSVLFHSSPTGTPNAFDLVSEFLAAKSNPNSTLQNVSISNLAGMCDVRLVVGKVSIDLFAYTLLGLLHGLPELYIFLIICILVFGICMFILCNMRSKHPFAVVAALISVGNLATKCSFLAFLFGTDDSLIKDGISDEFFTVAKWVVLVAVVGSFFLCFFVTVFLWSAVVKNSAKLPKWVDQHWLVTKLVLCLCGINPGNLLVLCSETCNSESFRAPIPWKLRTRVVKSGFISLLLSDAPVVCVQILTLFEVENHSSLQWEGSASSVIIPLALSSFSLLLGLSKRCYAVIVTPPVDPFAPISQSTFKLDLDTVPKDETETASDPINAPTASSSSIELQNL